MKPLHLFLTILCILTLALALPACGSDDEDTDGDTGDGDTSTTDGDESTTDGDGMTTDGDTTVEDGDETVDGDEPTDGDAESSGGTWYDATSGLTWQNPPSGSWFEWQYANEFCDQLTLDGYSDWRLPSISELRSLIRGCPSTVTDGSCGVTDSCLATSCYDDSCTICAAGDGPADGIYWPDEMEGTDGWYWSSSPVEDDASLAWGIYFSNGGVANGLISGDNRYRCVRGDN